MAMRSLLALLLLVFPAAAPASQPLIELTDPFPNLSFSLPVDMQSPDDGSGLLYVVEKGGRVRVFENDSMATTAATFVDITARVSTSGEQGLLGMAFDPDYATNRFFYLNYSVANPRRQRVGRFVATTPTSADPNSEVVLFEGDPALAAFTNHNAGGLAFGPAEGPGGERYLYVTMGDGGGGNDPQSNGQNPATLLGSIVRLDVSGGGLPLDCADAGMATVPPDNPLVDGPAGNCDEIFAYGFRNPWRITLDEPTGGLWVGDVGQSSWEEVDLLEPGGNFGWRMFEGNHCTGLDHPCDPAGKVFPVLEYDHTSGNCSITGGYVYRGAGIPDLQGWYVYADWCSGSIWAFDPADPGGTNSLLESFAAFSLTTFGLDESGELYALAEAGKIRKVVRLIPVGAVPSDGLDLPRLTLEGENPMLGRGTFWFSGDGQTALVVYDLVGREVARLFDGYVRQPAIHRVEFDGAGLPAAVYVVRLTSASSATTRRVVLVR